MSGTRQSYTAYPRPILWLIRGGVATIGGAEEDSQPAFTIPVASFYLSKLPVTNLQFEAFDPTFERGACSAGDEDPATGIDYRQARGYCDWYARVSRKAMRLPTEIEWEYACRGPKAFGLLGMLGGVREWTAEGVLRGGSDCAERREADPTLRADDFGFRIAHSLR